MRAAGLMFRITPFIVPTRWSLVPKSLVRVMTGSGKGKSPFRGSWRSFDAELLRVLLLRYASGGGVSSQDAVPESLRRAGNVWRRTKASRTIAACSELALTPLDW